ncbi:MAG: hypothetical protein DRO11_04625, partial [Methanobacteriota archaeon]
MGKYENAVSGYSAVSRGVAINVLLIFVAMLMTLPITAQNECLEQLKTRYVPSFGFTNGTIDNGTVLVLDGGGGNENWSFQVPDCELVIAYAHWHKWAKCGGSPTACFRNASGETCIDIEDCVFNDNVSGVFCSGFLPENGTHHYFWRIYPTPGTNWLNLTGCADNQPNTVYGKWVVVVMTNCSDPQHVTHSGQWWHNWGLWQVYLNNPYSTYFYNADSNPANYTLWTVQSHYDTGVNITWMNNVVGYLPYNTWFDPAMFNVSKQGQTTLWADWHHIPPDGSEYMYVYTATLAERKISACEEVPSIEVNKTVWDPVNKTWVDEIYCAKICDDYTFNCTIHNNGSVPLKNITFWDIASCSLEYAGNMTVKYNGNEYSIPDEELGKFPFKPRILHPVNLSWDPYNPVCNYFYELCPEPYREYHLSSWEDTNHDGKISPCDQIDMEDETGNILWYHVDNVPYTLYVTNIETGESMFIDSELDYQDIDLHSPWETQWKEVCCCKDSYNLTAW